MRQQGQGTYLAKHFSISNTAFIAALFDDLPAGAAPVVCGFPGDPNNPPGRFPWSARPALPDQRPAPLRHADWNNYIGISSFHRAHDGLYRRRKSCLSVFSLARRRLADVLRRTVKKPLRVFPQQ